MQSEFLKFIDHHNLFAKDEKILLAVSGGVDSVVLAALFHQSKRKFGIAHCNFQLRGKESDGDEEFVRGLSEKMKVAFYCRKFDTMKAALAEGISTQMAARELRYSWFNEILEKENYRYIAAAHHLNDSVETILFNLTKGTGIAGFHGIKVKSGNIIRPLLFAERNAILAFARANKLKWREDSSNLSDKYHRNLIRNNVIPVLKNINPGLENTVAQMIDKIQSTEEILLDAISRFENDFVMKKGCDVWIDAVALQQQAGKEILLYEIIKKYGFNYAQTAGILQVFSVRSGNLFYSEGWKLNVDRDHLIISPLATTPADGLQFTVNQKTINTSFFHLQLEKVSIDNFTLDSSPNVAQLDLDRLETELTIRLWKRGDRFCPLGMKQQKKLSDFMIDEKIPVNLKAKTFVLTSGEDIVWVIGYRIDDRFKVTDSTRSVLKIKKEFRS